MCRVVSVIGGDDIDGDTDDDDSDTDDLATDRGDFEGDVANDDIFIVNIYVYD